MTKNAVKQNIKRIGVFISRNAFSLFKYKTSSVKKIFRYKSEIIIVTNKIIKCFHIEKSLANLLKI